MHKNYNTKPNGTLIALAFIVLFIIIAHLCVSSLNNMESNKFVGTWSCGSETWVFEENGDLICRSEQSIVEGTYKIEKGHIFITMGEQSSIATTGVEEYTYYFSDDGLTLELHWVYLDGFRTLIKQK